MGLNHVPGESPRGCRLLDHESRGQSQRRLSPYEPVPKNVMQCLLDYHWPGNIRELRNVIERGIILSENGMIGLNGLPRELTRDVEFAAGDAPFLSLGEIEKSHIRKVVQHFDGNRTQAAQTLGISRKTLYRKLKEYNLD